MLISYDFGIDLEEYSIRGTSNHFPLLDECPNCKCLAPGNIHRTGYYWRYGIIEDVTKRIPICRLRCLVCKGNFSILPDFLIPYFQHTVHTVLGRLQRHLLRKKVNGGRQLMGFHLKRFIKNINWIHSYFSDNGQVLSVSKDVKKKPQNI